jgi:hypothetical protein
MKNNIFILIFLLTGLLVLYGCQEELTGDPVINNGNKAVFEFEHFGGSCLQPEIMGNYALGQPLDVNNSITLKVRVLKTGYYNISTNSINGYSFHASGNFSSTGNSSVLLPGTGTPVSPGINKFIITGDATSCDVEIPVTGNNPNSDHFPLSANSSWNYDDQLSPGDTISRTVLDSVAMGGVYYKRLKETYRNGLSNIYLFRKDGDDYLEYVSVDKYTSMVTLQPAIHDGIIFLKENLKTGQTWKSPEYMGTDSATGKPVMLQYQFICDDANANTSINGINYPNVYNITMQAYTRPDASSVYQSAREINGFFYAKGIGLLYMKKTNKFYNRMEIMIRNWKVY